MKNQINKQLLTSCPNCNCSIVAFIVNHKGYSVMCLDCNKESSKHSTKEEAMEAWNDQTNKKYRSKN